MVNWHILSRARFILFFPFFFCLKGKIDLGGVFFCLFEITVYPTALFLPHSDIFFYTYNRDLE